MTLDEIESMPGEFISTAVAAQYMQSTPNTVNTSIALGLFPFAYKAGKRNMIPKRAFVNFHRYGMFAAEKSTEDSA